MTNSMGWMLATWIAIGNSLSAKEIWIAAFWIIMCVAALVMMIVTMKQEGGAD